MNFKNRYTICSLICALLAPLPSLLGQSDGVNRVILDDISVANLGIETVEAEYREFAESLFAIGRIEPIPSKVSVLSSRIPGRVVKINAFEGDVVKAQSPIVEIESLQPGSPPPAVKLTAPLPGMVMKSHTHVGKTVVPENELFEIVDLTEVYAVARIPEEQAGQLPLGSKAEISVGAVPEEKFSGELVRFGTEANPVSNTINAYFVIRNPDYRLRPHMRAEFSVTRETKEDVLSVPRPSVQSEGVNRFVFVRDFELPNAFIKAPVTTGLQNASHVEILGGLFPGDEVVTRGAYALRFAGSGGISLKEALDAAHGHEHNEDGSEMTAAQRAQAAHDHHPETDSLSHGRLLLFLSILCGLLFILLVLSGFRGRKNAPAASN